MAVTTVTASTNAAPVTLLEQGQAAGFSIRNSDANALYILYGDGTVSSTNHAVAIAQDGYFESPAWYNGEKVTGIWAADGSGSAFVTKASE